MIPATAISIFNLALFGLFMLAPSLKVPWFVHFGILGWALVCLRGRVLRLSILLVLLLPAWSLAAEWYVGQGAVVGAKYLLGYWLPQLSLFCLGVAALDSAPRRVVAFWLFALLVGVCAFTVLERFGVDLHRILPSYKVAGSGDEEFVFYGDTRRLRAFYGEASVLSAVLVIMGLFLSIAVVNRNVDDSRRGVPRWLLVVLLPVVGLMLTVLSKSGIAVLVFALVAGGCGLLAGNISVGRLLKVGSVSVLVLGGAAVAYSFAPPALKSYFQEESDAISRLLAQDRSSGDGPIGASSRVEHWGLTADVVARYPLGSGTAGIREAYRVPRWFTPNAEMDARIPSGVYGLMNQWANVAAQTGAFGLAVLVFLLSSSVRSQGTSGLRWAAGGALVAFLFTVESFPYLALFPLAKAVLGKKAPSGAEEETA